MRPSSWFWENCGDQPSESRIVEAFGESFTHTGGLWQRACWTMSLTVIPSIHRVCVTLGWWCVRKRCTRAVSHWDIMRDDCLNFDLWIASFHEWRRRLKFVRKLPFSILNYSPTFQVLRKNWDKSVIWTWHKIEPRVLSWKIEIRKIGINLKCRSKALNPNTRNSIALDMMPR